MTLLHMAAEGGRFYLVKRFVAEGTDINIKDNSGVNMTLLLMVVCILYTIPEQLRRKLYA